MAVSFAAVALASIGRRTAARRLPENIIVGKSLRSLRRW
jgi:hypothetical protein